MESNMDSQKEIPKEIQNPSVAEALQRFSNRNIKEPNLTMYKSETQQEYADRTSIVFLHRYQKTLEHLSSFVRLSISIITNDPLNQNVKFTLVIERSKTVESLAHQIEAEYAFLNMEKSITETNCNSDLLITSLQVITVYDVSFVPLKFKSIIDDVLNSGDLVNVVCVFTGGDQLRSHEQVLAQRMNSYNEYLLNKSLEKFKELSQDAKMLSILHNIETIQIFQDYCIEQYEIENLLFWLEIEVLRNTKHAKDDDDLIQPSEANYSQLLLHMRYIYWTYMGPNSSLKLNVIDKDLLPDHFDFLTISDAPLDIQIFDNVQDQIFVHLSRFVLPSFEKHSIAQKWMASFDVVNYMKSTINPGEHYKFFPPDLETMQRVFDEAIAIHSIRLSTSEKVSVGLENGSFGLSAVSVNQFPTKTDVLYSSAQSGRAFSFNSRINSSHYGDGARLTNAQKLRRMQREKKLKKFFGDKPLILNNNVRKVKSDEPKVQHIMLNDTNNTDTPITTYRSKSQNTPFVANDVTELEDLTTMSKKKKKDKLEDFFGDQIPPEQLFEQRLIAKIDEFSFSDLNSNGESLNPEFPATENSLSRRQKRRILQTRKKLKGMLGEEVTKEQVLIDLNDPNNADFTDLMDSTNTHSLVPTASQSSATSAGRTSVTAQYANSLAAVLDNVKRVRESKEYQRKKLEKIQEFLGERINIHEIEKASRGYSQQDSPRPSKQLLNSKERIMAVQKMNKLQRMFGEIPPADLLISNSSGNQESTSDSSFLKNVGFSSLPNTLAIIEYLLTHDEDAIALNTLLEQFDIKEGILIQEDDNDADLFSDAPLTPTEPPNLREMMSEKGVEIMRHVRNRQRRRMEKLNRFFGTTAPSEAQEVSMEDETLLKLGKHLQDAIDPDDFKRLLIEMQTNLKEKTERRSSQITREIRSATDLPVKDNLLKTKSPPLLRKVSPDSIQVHVDSENEHRTTGGQKITEESLKKGSPISSNKL